MALGSIVQPFGERNVKRSSLSIWRRVECGFQGWFHVRFRIRLAIITIFRCSSGTLVVSHVVVWGLLQVSEPFLDPPSMACISNYVFIQDEKPKLR
jgi:hypothetical protein